MTESTIEIGRREALAIRKAIAQGAPRILIRKAAVLGAGVMGAQIAAHLANANVKPILFDLAAKEGKDKSAIANKAIEGLAKLNPSPIATASAARQITAANYEEHLEWLRDCDLVIEAISERMDWKKDLFQKVAPYIGENAI
ncbi:MAG TPA: 3-hydroxyacyl-CoA dehydrogenase NAD-binding domain-containing protein, partial [Gemmatimonadaceae bacterium]|nr:3-hydroxyacyl-CoA dehydrogenase NAD-binding domain-containing protein [Gemmatimonadaceae bacterium]